MPSFHFVDLMRIEKRAALYCLSSADHLTADGICISHKMAQSYIVRPWEAPPAAPVTANKVLTSRLMVSEPRYRKSLRHFASTAAGGLTEHVLQLLAVDMAAEGNSQLEANVVPLLDMSEDTDDGRLLATPPCRALLWSTSSSALPATSLQRHYISLQHQKQAICLFQLPAAGKLRMLVQACSLHA
jgi:hypothetical protein